jgi:DTW domain-containing protein YfiP
MATRTRFVFLMHPKEYKREKAATGRLTHLCLPHSRILTGVGFEEHPELRDLLADPALHPVLLFPGATALNLSTAAATGAPALAEFRQRLATRTLVVFILDATWALGRKMLRLSPTLQTLPRLMFTPAAPSRYVIKQQPHPACLSTLEATHELLTALAAAGLDEYPVPGQLPALFDRMQAFQLQCAADPDRRGYRHRPYKTPAERRPLQGTSSRRRRKLFDLPAD